MSQRKSDEAYVELRRRIMTAKLQPGSVLDEKALTEELGVGRTPFREAVLRLEQEGLVVALRRRGYIVASSSPADLMKAFELRQEIECFTAGLAAVRRTEEDLEGMDALLRRLDECMLEKANDAIWNIEADEEFHNCIAAASHNHFAHQTITFLYGLSVRSLYLADVPVTLVSDEIDSYRDVINAIRQGNVAGARTAMASHLTVSPMELVTNGLTGRAGRGGEH